MSLPDTFDAAGAPALSRERKAAMVVQMLLADGRRLPLDRLPERAQLRLTQELAQLRLVDKTTVDAVAQEFATALGSVGIAAPGSVEAALAALDGQISQDAMARLRSELGGVAKDPWPQIIDLPQATILKIMEREATEVSAVVLSKLPSARAAEVLSALPGPDARRIALAVSRTGKVSPSTVAGIGAALVADYVSTKLGAFPAPPPPRLGAILNVTRSETRDDLLAGLGEDDPEFAEEVRKSIFTYNDIPDRVQPTDLPKVLRLIDNEDLVVALSAGTQSGAVGTAATEFILTNMSKRMAESLREEMDEKGKVKKSDGEAAMAVLVTAIRDCADRGEIVMSDPGDDPDDED